MASRLLMFVNEWLIHDLSGENGSHKQKEAGRFLEELIKRCDRIVVLRGSPWMQKAYGLMGYRDPLRRTLSRRLHHILRDSRKCTILEPEEISELSSDLAARVPEEDRYLVQIYLSTKADLLITTDQKLDNSLSTFGGVHVKQRDDFLKGY